MDVAKEAAMVLYSRIALAETAASLSHPSQKDTSRPAVSSEWLLGAALETPNLVQASNVQSAAAALAKGRS